MLGLRNNCFNAINNDVDVLQQLKGFGLWEEGKALRLHLGCGEQHFDGYINIDYPPSEHNLIRVKADIYADIKRLNFPLESVDEIRLHHVFEHFNRVTALAMLIKWHEWLKTGGQLHIETPDLIGSAKTLVSDASWKIKIGVVRHLAGDQSASWGYHVDHWFPERFKHTLKALGFRVVEMLSTSWSKEPYLSNVKVVAIKSKCLPLGEQLKVAEKLLWESTVCLEEKSKWNVWKDQLHAVLAGDFVASPSNTQTPDVSSVSAAPIILSQNSSQLPLDEIHGFNQRTRNRWVQAKARTIPAGSRVLDVGAGTCPYRSFFKHCDYKTHDFKKYKGIKKNNTTDYDQIDYVSDITNIPVPDESFDVIICTEVLEHVPEPIEALREMARILKRGGSIFVTAPLGSGLHQLPYHYYGGLSPQWYRHFFPKFGLQLKEISPNGGFFKLLAQECARVQWTLPQHQHLHGNNIEFIRHLFGEWLPRYLFALEKKCFIDQFTVGYHVEATKNTIVHSINNTAIPEEKRIKDVQSVRKHALEIGGKTDFFVDELYDNGFDWNLWRKKILFLTVGCINYDCNINFYEPLKQIFSNVINYNYIEKIKQIGKESMNAEIIDVARKESPDYVLLHTYQDQVELETLDAIGALGIKVIAWFSDDHWRFENYSKIIAKHVFCSVTTDKHSVEKYIKSGFNIIRSQWASNQDYYQKTDSKFVYDVSFVGQNYGKRQENLLYLRNSGVPAAVFGRRFGKFLEFNDIIKIFNASKINLNFSGSSSNDDIKQIKGRVFEVPMCGGFLLTEYVDGIEEYYEIGKEIECFKSITEAVEKISYYLKHNDKRMEIANSGYRRALREHTWVKRLKGVFDEVNKIQLGQQNKSCIPLSQGKKAIKPVNTSHSVGGEKRILLTTSAAPTQSPFSTGEKRPPIGIGFLISSLRNAGHKVFFIDNYLQPSNFLETDYLQENEIDYVGIYANTICFRDTLRMVHKLEHLRQMHRWNGKIIIGGPHTTVACHTIPDFVDYIVQGEGEQAIIDIVDGNVAQRIVSYPRIENLDVLPMPAWDYFAKLPYDWNVKFFQDKPVFTMNTSRGCPFRCEFCSVGSIWGKRYTYFSAERIVSDIEHLVRHYGAKGVYFREDNFTLNKERLRKFCNLLLEKGIKIPWACESRVSNLSRDIIELMARAGAKGFYFGVESGSQRILDFLQKDITVGQIRDVFQWCHEFNVKAAASVIVGVPGETESDSRRTSELLKQIKPDVVWNNVFVGIPDSNLYRIVLNNRLYEYIDDRGLVYLQGHNSRVKYYYRDNWNAYIPDDEKNKDMTIKPKVSVLLSVYDCEKFIEQALKSIYNQTYQDFEVVIVDDGSTDKTSDILLNMKDSRTSIYRNSENKGLTKSLNIGLKLCRGEYVARMDADDISLPQRFEKQVRFLDENPNCAAVGSWCARIDSNGKIINNWVHPTGCEEIKKKLLAENSIFHSSAMVRRQSLVKIGGYDEKYKYSQDYDLWLRLSEVAEIQNLGEYLYLSRSSPESLSATRKEQQDKYAKLARQEALQRKNIQKSKMTSVTFLSEDINKKSSGESALDYFIKAGEELNRENFGTAIEYMQQYRSMIDYSRFPRILNKKGRSSNIDVSVIIVTYNRTEDLKNCLESLSKQGDANFEVIVVDNGGSDFKVFQQYTDQYIKCPINLILSEGRNIGACCAKGKIIAFLDDDALVPSNYISSIKTAFKTYDIFGLRGKALTKNKPEANRNAEGYDRGDNIFPTFCDLEGNSAFLREVFLSFEGMDPLLFGHEGSDLTYRITKKHGVFNKIIYWPDTVIYHDAATDDSKREKRNRYKLLAKYLNFKHNSNIFGIRSEIEKHCLPGTKRTGEKVLLQSAEKSNERLKMQVIGAEYGGWAVDLDLIPFGSTVVSAGVGEDISFDLGLINLKNCRVIGIDPTEKARKYIENNKNEHFDFLQKALYSESNKKIRIYKNTNPNYVSESITPSHKSVSEANFYEAESISIEDILNKYKNVSVLKMDIEGAEYEVLNSISKLDIPQICIEFHHFCTDFTADDTEKCIKHLQRIGYVLAHRTDECGTVKEATFVHQKYVSKKTAEMNIGEPETYVTKDIPVILVCYNRPKHTLEVLKALREHNIKNIYIFSDAPKSHEDEEAVSLTRHLVHSIDWTKPKIIERTENLGLARNIVSAVDHVFEQYDRLILLEDDCVPQRYFFDFMHTCLKKYENNQGVFGISGYTVKIPDHILSDYPYDLYFCPRIGSWGWATWKRAWQHYKEDMYELIEIAIKNDVDIDQGGTDIPISIENFLNGQLKDVWTLNWVLSVYVNNGVYIYPTRSHISNIGTDGTGAHCGKTDKYDSPSCDTRPTRYPDEVFLDERVMENFKSYYRAVPERSRSAVHFLRSLGPKKSLKIAQISTIDKKGGAAKVAWMLKEGLKARGLGTQTFVGQKLSNDPDVKIITDSILDSGTYYKSQGYVYYDIKSTFMLASKKEFLESDIVHFHNLHGDYFNPLALPALTESKPSVWTLHDMQSMTGHCAYSFDCEKWQTGCGNCPHLEAYPPITRDRTAEMWHDKKLIYKESDFELIVPSQWLKNIVEKSILKDKRVHLIYNGIDESIYRPLDKHAIRKMFKIPPNAVIISFVAHGGLIDKRKGGNFILEAYRYFTAKYPNVFFICVGGTSDKAPTERFLQIPFLFDEEKLVQLYCAADIFLFPTLADNCPLVILEVMGCGVPIVSFNTGGIPELIDHGQTGLIAGFKNSEEFIKMTEYLVADKAKREEFSAAGRERLLKTFTLDQMVDKHITLYERLAEQGKKENYVLPKNKVSLPAAICDNKHKYLVSAIVSTYNSEKFIRGCLHDLENQTIADKLEIIVVNSGSQENEESMVHEYQQKHNNIVYIKTEQREGIYTAWNRAIKVARGTFLTNANTDDRHREDALEVMAETLLANPDVALVYGDQICTDTPNGTFANHHAIEMARRAEYSHERLLFGCCVGSQPMWRKSLHTELGYFDDTLTCAGDWDFWLRISISSRYKFKHIPEFLGLYYYNENGIEHGRKIHSLYERYIVGKRYGNPYISVIPLYTSKDNPLVSVIMPAYNAAEHIAEAIESVLIQNYRNFELIVVDDGSTDDTKDIVASFKDDKIKYLYKDNGGPSSARNLAINKAKGQYIMPLDADDMMTPDFIAKHLAEFERHPDVDLVYCDVLLIGKNSNPIRIMNKPEYQDRRYLIRDLLRAGHPVVPFRLGIRRSVFDRIGFYDEDLLIGEDYDMMRRFVKAGLKAHHLSEPLHLRRMHADSLSGNQSAQKAESHFEVIKRFIDTFAYDELFPDVAWDQIAPQMRQLHAKCLTAGTYLAIGQEYVKTNATEYSRIALDLACSELNDCVKMDPKNQNLRQLSQKFKLIRAKYTEAPQQVVS